MFRLRTKLVKAILPDEKVISYTVKQELIRWICDYMMHSAAS